MHSNDLLIKSSRTLKGILLLINTATPPPTLFILSCLHKFMPRQSIASSGILSFNHVSVTQTISISCISTSISNSFILLGRDLAFTKCYDTWKDLLLLILVTLFSKETLIKLCMCASPRREAILEADLKLVPLMYDCSHLLVIPDRYLVNLGDHFIFPGYFIV